MRYFIVQETIIGKVTVLCTAKCPRNPQPSQHQVDEADYFFNKVYDAKNQKLVKMEQFERTEKSLGKWHDSILNNNWCLVVFDVFFLDQNGVYVVWCDCSISDAIA